MFNGVLFIIGLIGVIIGAFLWCLPAGIIALGAILAVIAVSAEMAETNDYDDRP